MCLNNFYIGFGDCEKTTFMSKDLVERIFHFGHKSNFTFLNTSKKDLKDVIKEILISKKLILDYLKTEAGKNLSDEKKSELNLHVFVLDSMLSVMNKRLEVLEPLPFSNDREIIKLKSYELSYVDSVQAETCFYYSICDSNVNLYPY
jgi:hypothetical protein